MGTACYVGRYGYVDTMGDMYMITIKVGWIWTPDNGITLSVMSVRSGGYYSVKYGVYYVSRAVSITVAGVSRWSGIPSVLGVGVPSV